MKYTTGKVKNYTFYDYFFEKTTVRYIVMDDTKNTFMYLVPTGMESKIHDTYETVKVSDGGYPDHRDWIAGSLVHLIINGHMTAGYDKCYKFSETTRKLKFDRQDISEEEGRQVIKTYLKADEGYEVCHTLTHYDGENGFEVQSTFINGTGRTVELDMITSASLDNLCVFNDDDGSGNMLFHTFKGGWAIEGKHITQTLPELNLEKGWGGSFDSEKIGSVGSKTVGRYHPYAAVEDIVNGCTWGMKLKHNATWQMELTRYGVQLSLSAGMGDLQFGGWFKNIADGESFDAPVAYIAVAKGGIDEVSNDLNEMNDRDIDAYGEEGMPIIFNEWVTHWGDTSHEKAVSLAKSLKDTKVKYFVIDDGWQKNGCGDWIVDEEKFPKGFKAYTDEIRELGFVPGFWMEFEGVRDCGDKCAVRYGKEYDHLYLKKNGETIVCGANFGGATKFIDFANKEARDFVDHALIDFIKENGIGYLKVDYNANIGVGCDGCESLGEGLRQHMENVYEYFKHIKEEVPDLIIENCSSGGSRLDPKMMGVTAMSSFSDAHESFEVPVIAANMHYLISPRQSQVWCVIRETFDENHMKYVISSGFLGRLCWSGTIDKLEKWQFDMMLRAEEMYERVCHIIKHGRSTVYRTEFPNYRYLQGTQAVVRYSENRDEVLVVYHCFDDNEKMEIELDGKYEIVESLYDTKCKIKGSYLKIQDCDRTGNVLHLKKK